MILERTLQFISESLSTEMEPGSIFRQLTSGISFNKKKYKNEACMFGLTKTTPNASKDDVKSESITLDESQTVNIEDEMSDLNSSNSSNDENHGSEDEEFKLLGNEIKVAKKNKPKQEKKKKSKAVLFKLHQEKINQFRNTHKIHVSGSDIPDPVDNWSKLIGEKYSLSQCLLEAITADDHGYSSPTPIQMQAIPLLLGMFQLLLEEPLLLCVNN